MILKNEELKDIKGGGMSFGLIASLVGLGAFLIGVLDGQIKLKWQNHKNTEFKGNFEEKPLIRIRRKD